MGLSSKAKAYHESKESTKILNHEEEEEEISSSSKAKRLWKKVKYQLVEYNALPDYLRDNEYILRYYRAEWPMKQVLLSMFTIHNETLNVWTHLVGFLIFLSLTIYTVVKLPRVVDLGAISHLPHIPSREELHKLQTELMSSLPSFTNKVDLQRLQAELKTALPSMHTMTQEMAHMFSPYLQTPAARWPFFVFLGGAMFCLLASSTCHLLSCHSELLSYIMLRLDYIGIAGLIATSFYPPVYYSFMCHPFFKIFYLSVITVIGFATIVASLLPVFQEPKFRTFRASLFFGMGVSGVAPILHKLILYKDDPMAFYTTAYEIAMGLFYGLGALVYAARVPERWKPGKFDIAGHSHQLFHVLVVAGAYTHYKAGLLYLQWRDSKGCNA
eukprot:TRINITY_DN2617_c0_g1_i1.p1 TRINITY_DN2617_c0_g1~~TRINITY_DN2617_c0_g1_i1.p1  ORF type:complete len:385 (-),score=43.96 TRINITY_DN2617_c0_g1_i1:239-1393(-)